MFRKALHLILALTISIAGSLTISYAQSGLPDEPLTNGQVLQMVRDKVSADTIIAKIKVSRCHFDTTGTVLDELQYQGIPPAVLKAMAEAPYGAPAKPKREVQEPQIQNVAQPTSGPPNERHESDRAKAPAASISRSTENNSVIVQPVTGNLADEVALGINQQNTLLSQYAVIRTGMAYDNAQGVFTKLRATAAFQGVPNLPYDVTIIQSGDLNAFTIMGGHLFVTSALAELMGNDVGLWAAVEGHEMAHNIYRHVYKKYLREVELQRQINYYRYRVALGDQSANWAIIAVVTAGKLLNKKLERNDENDADKLGLLMMVEAGYHPDFAINLARVLKSKVGDQSKFAAFFSGHPRWTTREERMRDLYPEAVARFRSLWPDAANSPGGSPPIIASLSSVSSKQDKTSHSVSLQLTYSIHNAKNVDLAAEFVFFYNGSMIRGNAPAFQDKNGSMVALRRFRPASDEETAQVEFIVPSSALGVPQRKVKAKACLSDNIQVIECSKEIEVSFPKD